MPTKRLELGRGLMRCAVAGGSTSSAKTSSDPVTWLTSAAATPSSTRNPIESHCVGSPRAAATSGSIDANNSGLALRPTRVIATNATAQTTLTTRGYLSNGISVAATLNGGDGQDEFDVFHALASLGLNGGRDDDRFTVRAFATLSEGSTKERFSNVNGGDGADFISYAVNAPINIDGGEGFDTVVILGTEFGDSFLVSDVGTWGAGLYISYVGIEQLEVNGGEGNDTFNVISTSPNMSTVILGGLGSDTFNVAGRPNRLDPLTVTSNDLQGHSGVITQSVESGDLSYDAMNIDGISANVYDNDEAGVMIRQSSGFTRVTEQSGSTTPDTTKQDEYWVVLTKAPDEVVRVTVAPAALAEGDTGRGISVNPTPLTQLGNTATTLVFTTRNWFIPQRVVVTALPDAVAEGTRFIPIQHSTIEGDDAGARVQTSTSGSTVSLGTTANRGAFTITANGQTTNLISFDATGATVRQLLQGIGLSVSNVTGSGTIASPWLIAFTGAAPTLTVDNRKLYSPYDALAVPTIVTEVIDDDAPSIVITPLSPSGAPDAVTNVLENGFTDSYTIQLTQRPTAALTVDALFDPLQLRLTSASAGYQLVAPGQIRFTFLPGTPGNLSDPGNWDVIRTVTVTAVDDSIRQGEHHASIVHVVGGTNTGYVGVLAMPLDVTIYDDDTPGVIITQTDGGTSVIESPTEMTLGNGNITGATGNGNGTTTVSGLFAFTLTGASLNLASFRFTRMQLLDPSGTVNLTTTQSALGSGSLSVLPAGYSLGYLGAIQSAILKRTWNIDLAPWTMFFDPNTGNTSVNTSESVPHISILGTGTNVVDTYEFTATAGAHGIFDIDFAHNVSAVYLDTVLALRDTSGNLLALNDDSPISYGAGGSVGPYDSYLEYTFGSTGTYRLEVWKYNHVVVPRYATYELNISLTNHALPDLTYNQSTGVVSIRPGGTLDTLLSADTSRIVRIDYVVSDTSTTPVSSAQQFALSAGVRSYNVAAANTVHIDYTGMQIAFGSDRRTIISQSSDDTHLTISGGTAPAPTAAFSIIASLAGTPWRDIYTVQLTKAPTADVKIIVRPVATLTTDHRQPGNGIRNNIQVTVSTVDGTQDTAITGAVPHPGEIWLIFTPSNWNTPQTVRVAAIDDLVVDGSDTQAFADSPQILDRIRGPLTIEGGFGGRPDPIIGDPVMIPFETNLRIPDGAIDAATTSSITDAQAPWVTTQSFNVFFGGSTQTFKFSQNLSIGDRIIGVSVNGFARTLSSLGLSINAAADTVTISGLGSLGFFSVVTVTVLKDITGFGFVILDGPATGQTAVVASGGVSDANPYTVNFTSDFRITPGAGAHYAYYPVNPNLIVIEANQVDVLNIYDTDSVADKTGILTANRLYGFGMAGDTTIQGHSLLGGISYNDLEVLNIALGRGSDFLTIESTHTGVTLVDTGAGNDYVDVKTIAGHTQVSTGSETDVVNVGTGVATAPGAAASQQLVNEIGALLVLDGGEQAYTGNGSTTTGGTTLTDSQAHFPSQLPAGTVFDPTRTTVHVLTQSDIGTLTFDPLLQLATFTPNARFDHYGVFAFEYDLWESVTGRTALRESHVVTIDLAALSADGNAMNAFVVDLLGGRGSYVQDLRGMTVQIGSQTRTIVANTLTTVTVSAAWTQSLNGAAYAIRGLEGSGDIVSVDDSSSMNAEVGTLTTSTLTGLGMPTGSEVQTVLVRADSGQFVLRSADWADYAVIDLAWSEQQVAAALSAMYNTGANDVLRVTRAGNRYTIVFGGTLAGRNFAPIEWVADDARNTLVSNNVDVTVDIRTATLRDGTPTPALNNVQTVTVDSAGGAFALSVNGVSTFNLEVQTITISGNSSFTVHVTGHAAADDFTVNPADSFALFQDRLRGVLDTFGVSVTRVGNVYTLTFGGSLAGVNVQQLVVTGATIATVTQGGSLRTFAPGASADDVLAGLQLLTDPNNTDPTLPRTRNVLVTKIGNVYTLFFQGSLAGSAAPHIGVVSGSATVATRMNGIDYYNVETLNIDLGTGNDVFNVQGTTARTNLNLHEGDERVYVSSQAAYDLGTSTDFLTGNLDQLLGMLNIRAGDGQNLLMISDESSHVGKDVLVTDTVSRALARDAAVPASVPGDVGRRMGIFDTASEIYVVGLGEGAITFSASPGTAGGFAPGVTIWSGWGNDHFDVDGTFFRAGGNDLTTLNTGLGDDTVTVNLQAGSDGAFVLNTQGPYDNGAGSDVDIVHAETSSLPLVIFGGKDADTIFVGTGNDVIFGDRGRVLYFDPSTVLPAIPVDGPSDALLLQLESLAVSVFGNGGPGDRYDGVTRLIGLAVSVDPTVGGNDTIHVPNGNNVVIGGAADDVIDLGGGSNLAFGDSGYVQWAQHAGVNEIAQAASIAPEIGGADHISTQSGDNLVVGGAGDDVISLGIGTNVVLGDSGAIMASPFSGPHFADLPLTLTSIESRAPGIGGNDHITTGSGDEIVIGGAGEDTIGLGSGTNIVFGDSGHLDWGAAGGIPIVLAAVSIATDIGAKDTIDLGSGNNIVVAGAGGDVVTGGSGANIVLGDSGEILGIAGNPSPFGTLPITVGLVRTIAPTVGGDDHITIGTGSAIVMGGAANDTISSGSSTSFIFGDNGYISWVGAIYNPENLPLWDGADTNPTDIDVVASTDFLSGGNDTITIGAGRSIVVGGEGDDTITGGSTTTVMLGDNGSIFAAGADTDRFGDLPITLGMVQTTAPDTGGSDNIQTGTGSSIVLGGAGDDTISTVLATDTPDPTNTNFVLGDNGYILWTGAEFETLLGLPVWAGADHNASDIDLVASTDFNIGGNDTITIGSGRAIVIGGKGDDTITGGSTTSVMLGDSGAIYSAFSDADRFGALPITLGMVETLAPDTGGVDHIQTGTGSAVIMGGAMGDVISTVLPGDTPDPNNTNFVLGDNGYILWSGAEFRTLLGLPFWAGADANASDIDLVSSTDFNSGGNDTITIGSGRAIVIGGKGEDTITGGSTTNVMIGDSGAIWAASSDLNRFGDLPITLGMVQTLAPDTGGNDHIQTGTGSSIVLGGAGDDTISTVLATDTPDPTNTNFVLGDNGYILWTATEFETLLGLAHWAGADANPADIDLVASTDFTYGGNDSITIGSGRAIVIGGKGDDTITGGSTTNVMLGDAGAIYAASSDAASDRFGSLPITLGMVETLAPETGGNDQIQTGTGSAVIMGGSGNDTISTVLATDTPDPNNTNFVLGDNGFITWVGQELRPAGVGLWPGADTNASDIDLVTSTDFTFGGDDTITIGSGRAIVIGGKGDDTIKGGSTTNVMLGDSGAIYAASSDAAADRFGSLPITLGMVQTLAPDIGGVDHIQTGTGSAVIMGGAMGDVISTVLATDTPDPNNTNFVLGDNGFITWVGQELRPAGVGLWPGADTNASDIDLVTSTDFDIGGNDRITIGSGRAIVIGGKGDDTITGGSTTNVMLGDSGAIYAAASNAPADRFGGLPITLGMVQTLAPSIGGVDQIQTGTGSAVIMGGSGDDTISTVLATDTIRQIRTSCSATTATSPGSARSSTRTGVRPVARCGHERERHRPGDLDRLHVRRRRHDHDRVGPGDRDRRQGRRHDPGWLDDERDARRQRRDLRSRIRRRPVRFAADHARDGADARSGRRRRRPHPDGHR